jgi:hypothetical protein
LLDRDGHVCDGGKLISKCGQVAAGIVGGADLNDQAIESFVRVGGNRPDGYLTLHTRLEDASSGRRDLLPAVRDVDDQDPNAVGGGSRQLLDISRRLALPHDLDG